MFSSTSRYAVLPVLTLKDSAGRVVRYVTRRELPSPDAFERTSRISIGAGERLDSVAAVRLGAPDLYWQICDANGVLNPAELDGNGAPTSVRVPLPNSRPVR